MPGLFDLQLEQLEKYQGRNPRPDDFDAYWSRALAELDATDPRPTLEPASFQSPQAECFDLWFTGVGDARIYAKFYRPRQQVGRRPAVLQFHGYTMHSGDWMHKLAYASAGMCVACMDCRGQGGLSQDLGGVTGTTQHGHIVRGLADHPDKLLYRQIFLDTAQLARVVMSFDEVDAARVGSMGGSQGGGLALACAALEPRIKRTASTYPFLCDYQRVWEMDLADRAYAELKTFFRHTDPTHANQAEWFRRLGYIDVQHLAPKIRAEVLLGVGLQDQVCPPSTQFAAYNRIPSPKERVIYPDFGHEALPGFEDRVFTFMLGL